MPVALEPALVEVVFGQSNLGSPSSGLDTPLLEHCEDIPPLAVLLTIGPCRPVPVSATLAEPLANCSWGAATNPRGCTMRGGEGNIELSTFDVGLVF